MYTRYAGPCVVVHAQQRGIERDHGQGVAIAGSDPERMPFGQRPDDFQPGRIRLHMVRDLHLAAPGVPVVPAGLGEIVGDRSEHIRRGGPDVAPAVAVVVDGTSEIAGWHELALAHRAGPGAHHLRRRHVTLVDDAQRLQQLLAEERRAPALVRQGRQRADHRKFAGEAAVVALDPPKGDDEARLDPVIGGDAVQDLVVLLHQLATARDPGWRQHLAVVVAERQPAFRLPPVALDHLGDRLDSVERSIQRRRADAFGRGLLAQLRQPHLERFGLRARLPTGCRQHPDEQSARPEASQFDKRREDAVRSHHFRAKWSANRR